MARMISRRPRPAAEYEPEPEPEEERPTTRRRAAEPEGRKRTQRQSGDTEDVGLVTTGWGGYKRTKEESPSKWEKTYRPPENEEGLIHFLEEAPYTNILQHWINEAQGQKSFTCLGSGKDCPLCKLGDSPTALARFNVVDLGSAVADGEDPVEPTLMVYAAGITIAELLYKHGSNPRTGPLNNPDLYFAVTMNVTGTGSKGKRRQSIRPVKARDLFDDFGIDPLTDDELESFEEKCWTADSYRNSTRAELEAAAASLK